MTEYASARKNLNIIAIDPSMRSTGIFYFKQGISTSEAYCRKQDRLELYGLYLKKFMGIAKETKWDLCIIEDYAFGKSGGSRSMSGLAEIGGIIRSVFSAHHVPMIEIFPTTWQSFTKFKYPKATASDKNEYRAKFCEVFGKGDWTFETTDECDAYLLYYTVREASRGHFTKGAGAKIWWDLDKYGLKL